MNQNNNPPVNEGQQLELHVESVGQKGDGIARFKGFIIVLPGAQKGDSVKAEITKVLPKLAFGKVLEKLDRPAQRPKERFSAKPRQQEKDELAEIAKEYDKNLDSEEF